MKSKSALVSIIVPVYNVTPYLNKCIESISNQTYKNIEILLIDDGSTDDSSLICDEWENKDNRITVVHKENGGVSSTRNLGLKLAKGEIIGFVDSDDYIDEDLIEKSMIKFEDDNVDIVDRCIKREYTYRQEVRSETKEELMDSKEALKHLLVWDGRVFSGCYKLYRKKAINNLYFDETIAIGEDTPFVYYALLNSKKYCKINSSYYHYVRRTDSACGDCFAPKQLSAIRAAITMYENSSGDLLEYTTCNVAMNCYFVLKEILKTENWKKLYKKEYKWVVGIMKSLPPFVVYRLHGRKTGLKWICLAYFGFNL